MKIPKYLRDINPQIALDFMDFHKENPQFYSSLKSLALSELESGRRISINFLFEKLRWDYLSPVVLRVMKKNPSIKINNNHRACYSRKLMFEVPKLEGKFKVISTR
jgi:hypothetical protein